MGRHGQLHPPQPHQHLFAPLPLLITYYRPSPTQHITQRVTPHPMYTSTAVFALAATLSSVSAHVALWDKGMFG